MKAVGYVGFPPVSSGNGPAAVALPIRGQYSLLTFFQAHDISTDDVLPHSGETLGQFLDENKIDVADQVFVDPKETLTLRLKRWGVAGHFVSVDMPKKFQTLILATLESYFRFHYLDVGADHKSALSVDDQFANALMREALGHDIYIRSATLPAAPALSDGSVLFETAFAPVETNNFDLLRDKFLLLSQLEMIRLDEQDHIMNGREQRELAASYFDAAVGTNYADRVRRCGPAPTAIVDLKAIQGPTPPPFSFPDVQAIAAANFMPAETFIRALVVFHALAIQGVSTIHAKYLSGDLHEANATMSPVPPQGYGAIDFQFSNPVKQKIKSDLDESTQTGADVFFSGDSQFPGTKGPNGFIEKILFGNFGIDCP